MAQRERGHSIIHLSHRGDGDAGLNWWLGLAVSGRTGVLRLGLRRVKAGRMPAVPALPSAGAEDFVERQLGHATKSGVAGEAGSGAGGGCNADKESSELPRCFQGLMFFVLELADFGCRGCFGMKLK